MLELQEFIKLVDDHEDRHPDIARDVKRALQVMLFHQCVYQGQHGTGNAFDVIIRHRLFFEKFFATIGYSMQVIQRDRMIALQVEDMPYGWKQARFKKDETAVLLVLKLLYEEAAKSARLDDDFTAGTTTDEIVDYLHHTCQLEIEESRLRAILKMLRRRGTVKLGDRDKDEQVTPIVIRPMINILVTERYVESVRRWAETGQFEVPGADAAASPALAMVSEDDDSDDGLFDDEEPEANGGNGRGAGNDQDVTNA
jgi:hypothetical protein